MTWGDRFFVGDCLILAGCWIWALVADAPSWFQAALAVVCIVNLLLFEAANRWGAFRALRRGVTGVVARIGGDGPASNARVAKAAVERIQDAFAAAEKRCGDPSEPSGETRAALIEVKAEIERGGVLFRRIASEYEDAGAFFRSLEGDLSGVSARVDQLLAAPEGADAPCAPETAADTSGRRVWMVWKWHFVTFTAAVGNWGHWVFGGDGALPPFWVLPGMVLVVVLGLLQLWDFVRRAWDGGLTNALALEPGETAVLALGGVAMVATEHFTTGIDAASWVLTGLVVVAISMVRRAAHLAGGVRARRQRNTGATTDGDDG